MFARVNGQLLHSVSFGAGPHTLLAHGGWIGNWELWLQPMELLSPTWRTVAYDHRGASETKTDPAAITATRLVDDVLGMMDAYGIERCILASESAGAQTIIPALLRAPSRIEALILVAGLYRRERTPENAATLAAMQGNFSNLLYGTISAGRAVWLRKHLLAFYPHCRVWEVCTGRECGEPRCHNRATHHVVTASNYGECT
jgi:pimeloyl-ACP methyl ester carboxylesterase